MKDKLLIFLAGAFYHFGIVNALKEKYDCDLFAIVDVDDKPKKFFLRQKLVEFKKIWFYRDHVSLELKNKPDMKYLASFEEKYGINLWNIAYADKKFYKYNRFYKFSYDEILRIFEQTCKLYELIIDESKPDFLLMGLHDSHRNYLLYEICKARDIKIMLLGATRFGYRAKTSQDEKYFDFIEESSKQNLSKNITSNSDLLNYLKKFDHTKQVNEFKVKYAKSTGNKFSTLLKFFLFGGTSTSKKHFSRYGLSRSKLIRQIPGTFLNMRSIRSFIEKNAVHVLDKKTPFVYYPLHSEPERALSIAAPFFTNQIEVITNIAKSLPVGYKLFVKEHPNMTLKHGTGRKLSFYKDLLKLPNVRLIHPEIKREEILEKCSLVITINGTAGLEAAFHNKPSITLIETDYSSIPSVYTLKRIEELPIAIRTSLGKTVDQSALFEYVNMVDKNSFEYNKSILNLDFYDRFFDRGFVIIEKEISEQEMKSYLDDHKEIYEKLALEFIKKIKQYKEYEPVKKIKP